MHRKREKKGISTIIAAVFMIAIIILGLGVLTAGLNMQNDLGQVVTERTGLEAEQIKERVEMRDVRVDNNKFNMTLVNTGMLPVKIVRAWVTNTTAPNGWHTLYDNLNYLINPGDSYIGFGQNLTLTALTTKSYEIKVVTERGTTTTFKILNGADAKLNAQLIAPAAIHPGERVTVTMIVTHNNTLADAVLDIKPPTDLGWSVISGSGNTPIKKSGPTPTQDSNILRGSTRVYTWTYELTGSVNTVFRFSAQVQGQKSNTATVDVTLTALSITSTDYSSNSGILTMNYTSFKYTQGSLWKQGWALLKGDKVGFQLNVTNNNVTGRLWLSKNTVFALDALGDAAEKVYYITNYTRAGTADPEIKYLNGTASPYTCPGLSPQGPDDYCLSIGPAQTITLYFSAANPIDSTVTTALPSQTNRFAASLIIFGKFCSNGQPKNCVGTQYGQNLPFIGIDVQ